MNAVKVVMPQMGQSVAEGTVIQWFKREGDRVESDESLLAINTDKIDVEIPSPGSGIVARILVQAGETVPVGTPLATIDVAKPDQPHATPPARAISRETIPPPKDRSRHLSPAVLNLAEQHGLKPSDLQEIRGTGEGRRVTKQDVLAYLEQRKARTTSLAGEESIPFTLMRRAIAEHMVRSKQTSPHATAIVEVDMTAIAAFRETEKTAFAQRWGTPLTILPFVIRSTAKALRRHPWLNAWVQADRVVLKETINIGIPVAVADGLIVPVLKGAEALDLVQIAQQTDDLVRRAREKRLTPQEVQGGTFTVNNLGVFGIVLGTPIIVQPQAAILAFGAVTKRPIVIGDDIAIRFMAYVGVTFDHRVIDGAAAGAFLQDLKADLEGFTEVQK